MQSPPKTYLAEILARIGSIPTDIPAHRAAFKQGYSFSKEPFETQLAIWDHTWNQSGNMRAQIHAFFFLEQSVEKKELHHILWHTSAAWQEQIDDWGLCDALAKINTKVLETYPDEVYRRLALWNKDSNLWKRRQSVVSLLYYSRTKKVYLPFEKIIILIEPLLADKEYYVQKGVGWALREMHNVYPADAFAFLVTNINEISAIAFTIAIEKMSTEEKTRLKEKRKARSKSTMR